MKRASPRTTEDATEPKRVCGPFLSPVCGLCAWGVDVAGGWRWRWWWRWRSCAGGGFRWGQRGSFLPRGGRALCGRHQAGLSAAHHPTHHLGAAFVCSCVQIDVAPQGGSGSSTSSGSSGATSPSSAPSTEGPQVPDLSDAQPALTVGTATSPKSLLEQFIAAEQEKITSPGAWGLGWYGLGYLGGAVTDERRDVAPSCCTCHLRV